MPQSSSSQRERSLFGVREKFAVILIRCCIPQEEGTVHIWFVADFQGWCPMERSDGEGHIRMLETLSFRSHSSQTLNLETWTFPLLRPLCVMPLPSWRAMRLNKSLYSCWNYLNVKTFLYPKNYFISFFL